MAHRVIVLLAVVLALLPSASAASGSAARASGKVTLCHKVGGPQYVQITIASSAALSGHARNHDLDIIPPFGTFRGQNWNENGQAIWNNGCVAPPSPQPIIPSATCVQVTADGSTLARFGYRSDNVVERTIAIGDDNAVTPDGPNRGQPTTFQPGTVEQAFSVTSRDQSMSWTVRYAGTTATATATVGVTPPCETTPPIKPSTGLFVTCVQPRGDGTYDATFGYQNDEAATITVPVGANNAVSPGGPDRGQPSVFLPGRVATAFTVSSIAQGATVRWTVSGGGVTRTATATTESPLCETPPAPAEPIGIFVSCITRNSNDTYDATFGYDNRNEATVEIPVGLENRFAPDPRDRGQPSEFASGTVRSAFVVRGIDRSTALMWTLSYQGTRTAVASWDTPEQCATPTPPPESIGVFLTCVERSGRTYSATFGYENSSAAAIDVPIGRNNGFAPAPLDRGQPEVFGPGNVQKAFTVTAIPVDVRPRWTVVAADGERSTATATPDAPDCVTAPPPPRPDPELPIEKTASTRTVVVGQPVLYRLSVTNTGTGSAVRVRLRDRAPRGLRIVSVRRGALSCTRGRGVVCRLSRLVPGRTMTFSLIAQPTVPGTVTNPGEVGGGGGGGGNDSAVITVRPMPRPEPDFTG